MTRYIQDGTTGHMKGSIGDGRDSVPTPARTTAPDLAADTTPLASALGDALAKLRIQTPVLRPGMYVLEVFTDDRGRFEFEGQRAGVSIYGPIHADRVQEWMNDFPADMDLLDMFAVDAEDLDGTLREMGFDRHGQPLYVNDPDPVTETDDDGYSTEGFTGSLRDLPGQQRTATLRASEVEAHLTTTATDQLPPSDTERTIVATAVDDFFDRLDDAGASAVWRNDVTGVWQVVDRDGIQRVWVRKSFDYCTEFSMTPQDVTFTLQSGTVLTASRVDGVDKRTLAWALETTQPATPAQFEALLGVLHAMTVEQQVEHYVSSAGQRSLGKRLTTAVKNAGK